MLSAISSRLRQLFSPPRITPTEDAPANSKFVRSAPQPQNEINLFAGRWASDLSEIAPGTVSGATQHFSVDPRPMFALETLVQEKPCRSMRILELGPLEGGHTYQFERNGVREIVAVESNVEAFIKCLIVKNIAGLRNSRFLLGDFIEFLKTDQSTYDLIFCCGVLYHMEDPLLLVERMAGRSNHIFLWTHYYTAESRPSLVETPMRRHGEEYMYHKLVYENADSGTFWGGNRSSAAFLTRADIFRAFAAHGFTEFKVHEEDLHHEAGPCLSVSFWKV